MEPDDILTDHEPFHDDLEEFERTQVALDREDETPLGQQLEESGELLDE